MPTHRMAALGLLLVGLLADPLAGDVLLHLVPGLPRPG